MLTLTWFESLKDTFTHSFAGLWLVIDGIAYRVVSLFFRLFYSLADYQIFDNSVYDAISTRIYLFVGIIALFILSISLLKSLVNPDELNKGVIKSFKSLVTSVLLMILMPTIFKYVFSFQNAILSDDLIGKIFQVKLSDKTQKYMNSSNTMESMCTFEEGQKFNVDVFAADGKTISSNDIKITERQCRGNYITLTVLKAFFTPASDQVTNKYGTTWAQAEEYMVYTGNFNYITTFAQNAHQEGENNSVSYMLIISTVAAGFLIYLLLSFSIDLGVRAAKLAFYQIISPIPVLLKIIPGKEGQFDKWSKSAISTFLELFVRILIINFVVFMCSNLFALIDSMKSSLSDVSIIAKAIVAMGLFAFAKQAPKLLADALGIDGGNLKLGIKGKLADGGAFAAGAAVGGLTTAGVRNAFANGKGAINDFKNGNVLGGIKKTFKTPFSTVGGAISGGVRGAIGGYSAKNYGDVKNAAGKAAKDAVAAREKREAYRAEHNGSVIKNKALDAGKAVKSWATGSAAGAVEKVNYAQAVKDAYDQFESMFSSAAYNKKKDQLAEYKTLWDAGVKEKDGANVQEMIKRLEGSLLSDRIKAMSKNTSGYAYNLKQIAAAAKKNPELMTSIGINSDIIKKMDDYTIRGNKIVDKTGAEIKAEDLISIYEGTEYKDLTHGEIIDANGQKQDVIYENGVQVSFEDLGARIASASTLKDGYKDQKKKAADAITEGKTSIEYKEEMKRREAKK